MKEKYSVSRINTYLQNPFKHWCKYIQKLKPKYDPEANKYMDRGTVFHKVMERVSLGDGLEVAKGLAIAEATEKGFSQEAKNCAMTAVNRYVAENGLNIAENAMYTEYKLEYDLSDTASFIGYIDAIVPEPDGGFLLVDYKTFSKAPQADMLRYSMQANMYMYVATKLGFKVNGFMFDCVNPKQEVKGRAYKTKRIEFRYNEDVCKEFYEQFCTIVSMIEKFPDFRLYIPSDYLPDKYDLLYKVMVGEIMEDLDEFVEKHFEPITEQEQSTEKD